MPNSIIMLATTAKIVTLSFRYARPSKLAELVLATVARSSAEARKRTTASALELTVFFEVAEVRIMEDGWQTAVVRFRVVVQVLKLSLEVPLP